MKFPFLFDAKPSLYKFLQGVWPACSPAPFVHGRHLQVTCDVLESLGPDAEQVFSEPPAHGKSALISSVWPAWRWLSDPTLSFICVSYDEELAQRDARRFRDIVHSPYFQRRSQTKVVDSPIFNLRNDNSGTRLSTTIGGRVTGHHASGGVILDDLIRAQAVTPVALEDVRTYIRETIPSRRLPGCPLLVTAQRLAMNDASGLAVEDGANELRLPVYYETADPDPRDWRKVEGELLWPERFKPETIRKIRSQLGARAFNSQYLCRPSLVEGNFIKESDIQRYIDLPVAPVRTIIAGDLAFTGTETSDYTVFQVWHEYPSGCFYLAVQRRGQWAFGRAKVELEKLAIEYPKAQIYLEKAANASATADSLAGVLGSRLELVKAIASKDNRVAAVAPLFEQHRIFVPSWMNMKAWTEFPACRFDDEPDCGALALSILSAPDPKAAQKAKNLKGWAAWGDPQVQERYRQLYGALGRVR